MTVSRLQVQRCRIVQTGLDAHVRKPAAETVAIFNLNDVQMEDLFAMWTGSRKHERESPQRMRIVFCGSTAEIIPSVQMPEFYAKESALDTLHAHVVPWKFVLIFPRRAVISPQSETPGESSVIGGDRTALSAGAQVLGRIETEASGESQ